MKKIITVLLFIFVILILNKSFAQNIPLQNNISTQSNVIEFSNGDIISSSNGTLRGSSFTVSSKAYDEMLFGVYSSPSDPLPPKMRLVPYRTEGIFEVKYNSENGAIHEGDLITSSSEAGVGMKSTQSGMVIGIALEDANSTSGLLKIRILIQYVKQ